MIDLSNYIGDIINDLHIPYYGEIQFINIPTYTYSFRNIIIYNFEFYETTYDEFYKKLDDVDEVFKLILHKMRLELNLKMFYNEDLYNSTYLKGLRYRDKCIVIHKINEINKELDKYKSKYIIIEEDEKYIINDK